MLLRSLGTHRVGCIRGPYVGPTGLLTSTQRSTFVLPSLLVLARAYSTGGAASSDNSSEPKKVGIVKSWFPLKGFGFIEDPDTKKEIFCHYRDITVATASGNVSKFKSLLVGETVEFNTCKVNDKPRAVNVTGPNGGKVQGIPVSTPRSADDIRAQSAAAKPTEQAKTP